MPSPARESMFAHLPISYENLLSLYATARKAADCAPVGKTQFARKARRTRALRRAMPTVADNESATVEKFAPLFQRAAQRTVALEGKQGLFATCSITHCPCQCQTKCNVALASAKPLTTTDVYTVAYCAPCLQNRFLFAIADMSTGARTSPQPDGQKQVYGRATE